MGWTAAAALRAAVLCTWLIVTSGQMRGGEFAAEDVVEKLLKNPRLDELIYNNPRLSRVGRTRIHELLRDFFDYYPYSDYSDYNAMSEKLMEMVRRMKEGVVEAESEEATMCGAPVTEPCTCDKELEVTVRTDNFPWHDAAAMAWSSTAPRRRRTKDYLPATQPEESITPQSSRNPNELFASELV